MTTVYPGAIDGYSEIRIVRDNIEEIIADDHNDLRSAIIALEQTLGINPQGAFGSVNARLNDSYANIEKHADGEPPRHIDSHIDSPVRTSSPYSLSLGTVATQLNEILTFLNASTKYDGSGATTFADGYALPSAYITSTITQIINQLGISTGSSKVGGSATTSSPTDANTPPYNLTATTLRNQLIALLTYINNYNLSTGAANIGSASFSSEPNNKYAFSGSSVQDQIEETGSFLNENANLLERTLDTFVSDGMAVTQYGGGPNASVAAGFIISDGRLLKYDSGTITVSTTPGSYYIYARISSGSVVVASASSLPFSTTNPIVVLHKITHSGGAWSTSIDMRRYGIFINDKSCFTVGSTPGSGNDGYGCDFTTLKGAIEYVKVMNASNIVFAPKKIRLVNDVSYSGTTITIDVEGLEIDGAGRKILLSSDIPLFTINVNNVKLKNISIESNIVGTPASASLAKIGNTVSINSIQVYNCIISTGGGYSPLAYFVQCGSNTTTVSNSLFSNNFADVTKGGLDSTASVGSGTSIIDSVVEGNRFYQASFSAEDGYGVRASARCIITDNIISGGYKAGIFCTLAERTNVNGNVLTGYSAGSGTVMNNGIAFYNSALGQDSNALIEGNTIFGINNYGINCRANASGSGAFMMVANNIINNYYAGTPPSSMIGIKGRSSETWIVSNKIIAPGQFGIMNADHIINNQIYGITSITTTTAAIQCVSAATEGSLVSDNWIYNCAGSGIDINAATKSIIVNNIILQAPQIGIDISSGSNNIVSNNIIEGKGTGTIGHYAIYDTGNNNFINNNYINDPNYGGISISGTYNSCLGNYIQTVSAGNAINIDTGSNYSKINDNFIYNVTNGYGIKAVSSSNLSICGNHITNPSADGIHGDSTTDIQIIGNIITGASDDGIQALNANRAHICSNKILSCSYGIYITGGVKHLVGNNYIYSTTSGSGIVCSAAGLDMLALVTGNRINISASDGISVAGNYISVTNNHIDSATTDGITVVSGTNLTISNNYLYSLGNDGINASVSGVLADSIVNGNYIISVDSTSGYGIKANSTAHRCTMSGNYIKTCYRGISTGGSDDIVVSSNIVLDYFHTAYHISGAYDCLIIGNRSTLPASGATNCWGIDIYGGQGYLVVGNWAEGKGGGTAVYTGGTTSYLILGNLSEGGSTPASFSGPPVGTQVINNWEVYS